MAERFGSGSGVESGYPDPGPCVLHLRCGDVDRALYAGLAELVGQFTPVVQAVPPDVILADVRSAVRYFERLPEQLALMIVARARALYDVRLTIGVAGNRSLAAMEAGEAGKAREAGPARVRAVVLRTEGLAATESTPTQLSLDPDDEKADAWRPNACRPSPTGWPPASVPAQPCPPPSPTFPRSRSSDARGRNPAAAEAGSERARPALLHLPLILRSAPPFRYQ